MEIFDIVDACGNPTGQTVDRETAHREGIRHRTAHIWVIRERDGRYQVLLQKRSMNKDSFPGRYDTSSAGHIQAGDGILESAVRELGEELGIHAAPGELERAGSFDIAYEKEFHHKRFCDNEIAFVHILRREIDEKSLVLQKEEVEDVAWFDLEETYRECLKHNQKFCVPVPGLEVLRTYLGL